MAVALDPKDLNTFTAGVSPTPSRRRFTAAYKREILAQTTRCTKPGELGALLRREGLYSSHLAAWRAAERRGELSTGVPPRRRGPAPRAVDPSGTRVAELERALAKATARAERAEALVEVQKKVSALLDKLDQVDQLNQSSDNKPTGSR